MKTWNTPKVESLNVKETAHHWCKWMWIGGMLQWAIWQGGCWVACGQNKPSGCEEHTGENDPTTES